MYVKSHRFLIVYVFIILVATQCSVQKQEQISINYVKKAYKKYQQNDFKGAIVISDTALTYNPKDTRALWMKGDALGEMGNYAEAVKMYDSCIKIKPGNGVYYFNKGNALGQMKKYKEAILAYDYAINKNFHKACSYNNRGNVEGRLKLYNEALLDYDSSIRMGGMSHRSVFINKANVYFSQKKYELALKEIDQCIKVDSSQLSYPAHYKNMSEGKLILEKNKLMLDSLFIKTMKKSPTAYTLKGYIYLLYGNYKMALTYLNREKLLPIPDDFTLYCKGLIAFNAKQYDLAQNYFDSSILLSPKEGEGYYGRGLLFTRLNKYKEAMSDFNTAISNDSTFGLNFLERGKLYILMGKTDDAINDFTTAIKLDDIRTNAEAYNARGFAYFLNQHYQQSLNDYDSAKSKTKTFYQPYYEYRREAKDAINNSGNHFCSLIEWQSPISDVNDLVDNGNFHISRQESFNANFKITLNHPIAKDKLFIMSDGQSLSDYKDSITVIKENQSTNEYKYEFAVALFLKKGRHLIGLDYGNTSSQRIAVIVE